MSLQSDFPPLKERLSVTLSNEGKPHYPSASKSKQKKRLAPSYEQSLRSEERETMVDEEKRRRISRSLSSKPTPTTADSITHVSKDTPVDGDLELIRFEPASIVSTDDIYAGDSDEEEVHQIENDRKELINSRSKEREREPPQSGGMNWDNSQVIRPISSSLGDRRPSHPVSVDIPSRPSDAVEEQSQFVHVLSRSTKYPFSDVHRFYFPDFKVDWKVSVWWFFVNG